MPQAQLPSFEIDPASRTEMVVEAIRKAILRGDLQQGTRLVERDLAAQLGVSKTPVREAIKILTHGGLVISHPYKGTAVRTISVQEAQDILQVRQLLEPTAILLATPHHTRESVQVCRDALNEGRIMRARADLVEASLANRQFHASLSAPCPNTHLVEILETLRDQTALISVSSWRREATWSGEADEHEAILEAVSNRNAESAAEMMALHISNFTAAAVLSAE